jgi:hypothetical protein
VNNGVEAKLNGDGFPLDRPDDQGDVAAHGFGSMATPPSLTSMSLTQTLPQHILRNQEKVKKKKYLAPLP